MTKLNIPINTEFARNLPIKRKLKLMLILTSREQKKHDEREYR